MRSCRSRHARGHYAARNCLRLDPRCAPLSERPGSPVTSKDPPVSASLPRRPDPGRPHVSVPADRSRATSPYSPPVTGACLSGFLARPTTRNAARSRSKLLAPQRRSPIAHLSPGFVPRHRRTRRVRRLDFHQALQGRSRSPSDIRPARARVRDRAARRRASSPVTARMGRLSRHYSSSSPTTLPHARALRHEPVTPRNAPATRATTGSPPPVTNFQCH